MNRVVLFVAPVPALRGAGARRRAVIGDALFPGLGNGGDDVQHDDPLRRHRRLHRARCAWEAAPEVTPTTLVGF